MGKTEREAEKLGQWSSDMTLVSSINAKEDATRVYAFDTEEGADAQAIWERGQKLKAEQQEKGNVDDGIYRGQAGYQQFHKIKESDVFTTGAGGPTKGPARRPTNFRETVRFDYAPDICKDYRDTGFCGFGDSCKFMHDRGDYKAGWQIEKEYAEQQKEKERRLKLGLPTDEEEEAKAAQEEEEDDGLPFACLICKGPFKEPMVTKCGHYFCNKCAMEEYKKDPHCFACRTHTGGVFNVAKNIIAKMKRLGVFGYEKEEKASQEKEKEGEQGGSSEDEEQMLKDYYEQTQKRGTWKPKQGTEGWMYTGTTFRLTDDDKPRFS